MPTQKKSGLGLLLLDVGGNLLQDCDLLLIDRLPRFCRVVNEINISFFSFLKLYFSLTCKAS